jgi:hypothetical protein
MWQKPLVHNERRGVGYVLRGYALAGPLFHAHFTEIGEVEPRKRWNERKLEHLQGSEVEKVSMVMIASRSGC